VFVKSLGLSELPAFAFIAMDGELIKSAEGWNGTEWREVADAIAKATAWSRPGIPANGDPVPFRGTPALT
jgi:hypothetical protein